MTKHYSFDQSNSLQAISNAIKELEDELKRLSFRHTTIHSRLVLCEELLLTYSELGYNNFSIRVTKQLWTSYMVIRIEGDKKDVFDISSDSRGKDPKEEISKAVRNKILQTGSVWAEYHYKKNVNEIRILLADDDEILSERIFELYRTRNEELQKNPLILLKEIFKWDPARCIGAVLTRTIKRAALLLIPVCTSSLIDEAIKGHSLFTYKTLLYAVGALLLLGINFVGTCFAESVFISRKAREIETAMKSAALKKLEYLSMEFINKLSSGSILSKIIKDAENINTLLIKIIEDFGQFATDLVVIIIMTLLSCPPMLLFYLITVPIVAIIVSKFRGPIRTKTTNLRRKNETATGVIRDMQEMQQLTRLHGLQKSESQILNNQLLKVKQAGDEYDHTQHFFKGMTSCIFQVFQLVCLAFALFLVTRNIITIGLVILFQSYFENLVNSVTKVIDAMPDLLKGYESLVSLNEILCSDQYEKNGDIKLSRDMKGEIEFKDVVMRYKENERPVIDHLSFSIPAGKSVAFVGESGSGKTTILNLITGILHKESGEILIDGIDIDSLDKESYRYRISVVPQNTVLFSGTLWDNLVYGIDYIITEKVMGVIEKVGLMGLISSLPSGLDSEVQESGRNFSGGQKQRISIARALLRKPKIMFFDEATSALDQESEEKVQSAIDSLMGSCTMIIVAHRLSTIRKCDYIYKLTPHGGITVFDSYHKFIESEAKE